MVWFCSIDVVSTAFEGQSAVNRQRMVYKAIWEELQTTVHAVDQMTTNTPAEAAARSDKWSYVNIAYNDEWPMSDCALDRFLYCLLYWNEFLIFKLPLQCVHIQPDTRFPIQNQEFLNSLICQMMHLVKSGVLLFILFMSVFQFAPGSF